MNFGAFVKAIGHDVEAVWEAIKGSPEIAKVEQVAAEGVAVALEGVINQYVPGPLSTELDALVQALAAKVVAAIPAPPAPAPEAPGQPAA